MCFPTIARAAVAAAVVSVVALPGIASGEPATSPCRDGSAGAFPVTDSDGSVPVGELLTSIGRCSGIDVAVGDGADAVRLPGRIDWTDAETALVTAARGYSWIAIYAADPGSDDGVRIKRFIVLGTGEAIGAVAAPLAHEPPVSTDPVVTRAVALRDVVKLSYRQGPEAFGQLRRIAEEAEDPAVRRAAFSAIAGVGGPSAESLLAMRGLHDPDPAVRLAAADGLMRTGSHEAVPLIRSASLREADPATRENLSRIAAGKSDSTAAPD